MATKSSKFKAVLFDLDDTLCNTEETKERVFTQVYEANESLSKIPIFEFIEVALKKRSDYLLDAEGLQTYSRLDIWQEVMERFNVNFTTKELRKLIDDYWKYSILELKLYPDVREVLEKLRDNNIINSILAGSDFYSKSAKLIHLGIDELFTYFFTADLVRIPKTDPKIYEYVVQYLKLKSNEVIMIGNDPMQDIKPANEAGLSTAQFVKVGDSKVSEKGSERPNYILRSLRGILELLNIT
ncbi:HAD-IA family hydrolase [Candidatus Dojkabacteria bacterium]|nr:HAD-IA family hydrolase [Candidatus Dojkabacteria bacterium]